jgi:hypothetical protein
MNDWPRHSINYSLLQISGIAILAIGIWMEVELYKYMEMSTEFSGTAPYVLIGTGSLIILIGSLACCCTVKGQPVLLYVVSSNCRNCERHEHDYYSLGRLPISVGIDLTEEFT